MKSDSKGLLFVTIQLLLIVAYFLTPNPLEIPIPKPLAIIAGGVAILGLVLTSLATLQLNTQLSPFPKPKASAVLIQTGAYKFIRHPIYTGLFLFALGWATYDGNTARFCLSFALLIIFYRKAKYEEQLLETVFDSYPAYQAKTRMLFPKVFR